MSNSSIDIPRHWLYIHKMLGIPTLVDEQRWLDISDGSPEALIYLIGVFLDQMQENLDHLKVAIEGQDAAAIRMTAHGARGSCLNFGIIGLVEPLNALEKLGASGQLTDAALHLRQAQSLFIGVRNHWSQYQRNHSLAA